MTDESASWWDEIERRKNWVNKLFYGDNLEILRDRIPAESIDLIYLDPPFNSNRSYNVLFADTQAKGHLPQSSQEAGGI